MKIKKPTNPLNEFTITSLSKGNVMPDEWLNLIHHYKIPEELIIEYFDNFTLSDIIKYQTLSEECVATLLSGGNIEMNPFHRNHNISYFNLTKNQDLSDSFLLEHIDVDYLIIFMRLEVEILNKLVSEKELDEMQFVNVLKFQEITDDFLLTFIDKLPIDVLEFIDKYNISNKTKKIVEFKFK